MSLALAFFSDEVNSIVRSLYVSMYVFFTSMCTVQFNRVRWVQASHDLTVDLAAVSKLGEDYFLRNIGKGSQKIKGVMQKIKIGGVLIYSFSLSLTNSLSLYLYIYLSLSHSISTLSLSLYLSLSLSHSLSR